jgi:hypothetical protein
VFARLLLPEPFARDVLQEIGIAETGISLTGSSRELPLIER